MKRTMPHVLAVFALLSLALAGCGGDVSQKLTSSPDLQAKVMNVIAQNAPLASSMVDKLLASDSTRTIVLHKILGDSAALQAMMGEIAKNQTAVDGVINLAVQDSTMRGHMLGVLEGIKMATPRR